MVYKIKSKLPEIRKTYQIVSASVEDSLKLTTGECNVKLSIGGYFRCPVDFSESLVDHLIVVDLNAIANTSVRRLVALPDLVVSWVALDETPAAFVLEEKRKKLILA